MNDPDKAHINVEAYAKAQNKKTVNKLLATYPSIVDDATTEDSLQTKILHMASIFTQQDKQE